MVSKAYPLSRLNRSTGRTATYVVAASNAPPHIKAQADYVCTGNSAIDVPIIQAELNNGGDFRFTQGLFTFDAQVVDATRKAIFIVVDNTTISGAGQNVTTIKLANAQTASGGDNYLALFYSTSDYNVTISDMRIDGNKANQTAGGLNWELINIVGGGQYTFDKLQLMNSCGDGIDCDGGQAININSCIGTSNNGAAFHWGPNTYYISISNCLTTGNGAIHTRCAYLGGAAGTIIVDDCYSYSDYGGFYNGCEADTIIQSFRVNNPTHHAIEITLGTGGSAVISDFIINNILASKKGVYIGAGIIRGAIGQGIINGIGDAGVGVSLRNPNTTISGITIGGTIHANAIGIQEEAGASASNNRISENILVGFTVGKEIITNSITSTVLNNTGYIAPGEVRTASGALVPTGTCTATTVTGTFTESPASLKPGVNTLHCTASGTISVVIPTGSTAVVTSGDATVTDSPKSLAAGTTVVTVATGAGADDFTITVTPMAFTWHNPEAQDILIKKVVINRTTKGGTATSIIDCGIADDTIGTNAGVEFFDDLDADAAAALHDSWVGGDGGTQTKWVALQDSASVTDGWIVGQIKTEIADTLAGSYYIEYVGK